MIIQCPLDLAKSSVIGDPAVSRFGEGKVEYKPFDGLRNEEQTLWTTWQRLLRTESQRSGKS